jgi:hypothetical protein
LEILALVSWLLALCADVLGRKVTTHSKKEKQNEGTNSYNFLVSGRGILSYAEPVFCPDGIGYDGRRSIAAG